MAALDGVDARKAAGAAVSAKADSLAQNIRWAVFPAAGAAAVVCLGLLGWRLGSARWFATEALLALVAAVTGGLVGFLFGIPRPPNHEANDGYRPSTNLEQISDWLTKILIGVGLVEFQQLVVKLRHGGELVARLLGEPTATPIVSPVVVVLFLVLGFLPAYLWTRIYYAPLLAQTDKSIFDMLKDTIKQQQDKIGELATNPPVTPKETGPAAGRDTGSGTEPAAGVARDPGEADDPQWPDEIVKKVNDFRSAPVTWESDPGRQVFATATKETANRRLSVELISSAGEQALVLSAKVSRIDGEPLADPVTFLLHPTYQPRTRTVLPSSGKAQLNITAYGWFSLVAIADRGQTILKFDLRDVAGAPEWFHRR